MRQQLASRTDLKPSAIKPDCTQYVSKINSCALLTSQKEAAVAFDGSGDTEHMPKDVSSLDGFSKTWCLDQPYIENGSWVRITSASAESGRCLDLVPLAFQHVSLELWDMWNSAPSNHRGSPVYLGPARCRDHAQNPVQPCGLHPTLDAGVGCEVEGYPYQPVPLLVHSLQDRVEKIDY